MIDSETRSAYRFTWPQGEYDLSSRTHIMGVLNVTPDSFSDGGRFSDVGRAVERAHQMIGEGADFLDIGGESTRPGSDPVPPEEELRRVLPVIERLAGSVKVPISIDTYKAEVAKRALEAGAVVVNDISGLTYDPEMLTVAAGHGASVVIMHMKGKPKTMQHQPEYEDVVAEVSRFLGAQAVKAAATPGIRHVIIDPGLGFGKTFDHNVRLMKNLHVFRKLGYPVLVGPSRKSFIGTILDLPPQERLEGTAAAVALLVSRGASIVRVHDVKEMKRVAKVADAIKT